MSVILSNVDNGVEIQERFMKFIYCDKGLIANKIDVLLERSS